MASKRIEYLDGLRGISIIAVVLFHAYSRWGKIENFEQSKNWVYLFSHGHMGVQIFFSLSGFLIYRSLLNTPKFSTFVWKRYLRLAPSMFIGSALIFFTSSWIIERPDGIPNLIDILPGATFIDPSIYRKILGVDVSSLDSVFWTLFIEVKFYIISALMFFLLKDKNLFGIFGIFLLSEINNLTYFILGLKIPIISSFLAYIGAFHYGWFGLGILTYQYYEKSGKKRLKLLLGFTFLLVFSFSEIFYLKDINTFYSAAITAAIFLIPFFNKKAREIFSSSILIFFGYISYPLYIIHQNIVTGLAIKLHNYYPNFPSFFYPLPFILLVIFVAFLIVRAEPALRKIVENFLYKRI